jgi:hypothetical protein
MGEMFEDRRFVLGIAALEIIDLRTSFTGREQFARDARPFRRRYRHLVSPRRNLARYRQ